MRPDDGVAVDPGNSPRQMYVKVVKYLGISYGITLCNTVLQDVINYECQAPKRDNTISHGGYVDVYSGKTSDWDQGQLAMQFSVYAEPS